MIGSFKASAAASSDQRLSAVRLCTAIGMLCLLFALAGPPPALGQNVTLTEQPDQVTIGEGWEGFKDYRFLLNALFTLLLATALGGALAYHPTSQRTMDSLEEAEASQTYIMYTVIGAVIGIMVVKYGLVVGFVVFGIGGLMRVRTEARPSPQIGRLIFVALVGLACGLNLPHVGVLATAFGFVLIYALEARTVYQIEIKNLQEDTLPDVAEAYRSILEKNGYRVLSEKKYFSKDKVAFVFRTPRRVNRDTLAALFEQNVPEALQGTIDWEIT